MMCVPEYIAEEHRTKDTANIIQAEKSLGLIQLRIKFNRIHATENYITEAGLKSSSARWVPANAVIVAMYGATAGRVAISKIPLTTNQACCNLVIDENKADYNYVYYWLCLMYEQLASRAIGSAQQNLNAGQIKEFPIIIPPLETQKKISAILSPLDDKIELNKRINANLEQQARAIFKHWFIDSDYRLGTASEIIEYHDSKRIPISSRERSKLAKIYPYYGAASVMDYVDRYIFDGVYLLLGEGCSV